MHTESTIPEFGKNGQGVGSTPSASATAEGALSREFHNFVADIEDLIKATTSLTGEDLARAKAKLSARVAAAKESVEAMSGAITERATKTAAVTNSYVHEQPWQSIGAGAVVGFLLGLVLARRT